MNARSEIFFEEYKKALKNLKSGKLHRSLDYLQKTIEKNPKFYDAYHLMAKVLQRLGRTEEAVRLMKRLDRVLGFDPEVKIEMARLEYDRGKLRKAKRILRQLLKRQPDTPEALCLMGDLHRLENQYEKAENCYALCLEISPSHWGARRGINEMLRNPVQSKTGEDEKDRIPVSESDDSDKNIESQLAIAVENIRQDRIESALGALNPLYRSHPENEMVVLSLSQALQEADRIQEAAQVLEEYLGKHPDSAMGHYQCAPLYNLLKSYSQARGHLEIALEIDPDFFEAQFEFGVTCHLQGDLDSATQAYRSASRLMPGDVRPLVNLAHLDYLQKRFDPAEDWIRRALEINPDCQEALLLLGNLYYQQERFQEAEQVFQSLLKITPQNIQAQIRLAQTRQELGDYATALKEWQRVIYLDPTNETVGQHVQRLQKYLSENPGASGEGPKIFG